MKTVILAVLATLAAVASVTGTSAVGSTTLTTDCIVRPVNGIVGGFVRTLEGLLRTVTDSIGGALKTVTTTTIRLTGSLTTIRDRPGNNTDHDDPTGVTGDGSGGVKILVDSVNQLIAILSKLGSISGNRSSDVLRSFPIDAIFAIFVDILDDLSGVVSVDVVNGLLEDVRRLRVQLSGLRNISTEIGGRNTGRDRTTDINRSITAIAATVSELNDGISNYIATAYRVTGITRPDRHIAAEAVGALMLYINVIFEVVETVVCLTAGALIKSFNIPFKAVGQLTPILELALNVSTILSTEMAGVVELGDAMPGQVHTPLGDLTNGVTDAFIILLGKITSQLSSVTGT